MVALQNPIVASFALRAVSIPGFLEVARRAGGGREGGERGLFGVGQRGDERQRWQVTGVGLHHLRLVGELVALRVRQLLVDLRERVGAQRVRGADHVRKRLDGCERRVERPDRLAVAHQPLAPERAHAVVEERFARDAQALDGVEVAATLLFRELPRSDAVEIRTQRRVDEERVREPVELLRAGVIN
jgi:hypothetical protein